MGYLRFIAVVGVMLIPASFVHATATDDAYIAGYAAGALKQNLKLDMPSLIVRDGIITLPAGSLETADRAKAVQILSEIPGLMLSRLSDAASQESMAATSKSAQVPGDEAITATESFILPTGFLPAGHLFKPLLADPRWAHFSASYRNYQSNNFDGKDIASVSFGETIPFYRGNIGQSTAQWESGLQAGVFSDFNLDASSSDLLNTDFIASVYSTVRAGQFSAFGRIYHQSSHLGDEFLLRKMNTKFERVNLSYEGADLKLSYELPYGIRYMGWRRSLP